VRKAPQVAAVADPFASGALSGNQQTAFATVTYAVGATDVTDESREAVAAATAGARSASVGVDLSGAAVKPAEGGHSSEAVGLVIAAIVLVITFGSLVAAGLPLLTALVGVGAGLSAIQVATGFFDLTSSTPALATMLGLAVAIDYALFVVSRYRHELALGRDSEEAAGRAVVAHDGVRRATVR